jgi:hypothetical protein
MVVPAFGFSVGDFVAVTSLIVAVVQALRGTSDDIRELKVTEEQLTHLKSILEQIALAVSSGTAISAKSLEILVKTCADCQTVLTEFKSLISKNTATSPGLAKYVTRIKFILGSKGKKVDLFQKYLQRHISTILLIQNELNRSGSVVSFDIVQMTKFLQK